MKNIVYINRSGSGPAWLAESVRGKKREKRKKEKVCTGSI